MSLSDPHQLKGWWFRQMPFLEDILKEELTRHLWPPQVLRYSGSFDLEDHLRCFENATLISINIVKESNVGSSSLLWWDQLNSGFAHYDLVLSVPSMISQPYSYAIFLVPRGTCLLWSAYLILNKKKPPRNVVLVYSMVHMGYTEDSRDDTRNPKRCIRTRTQRWKFFSFYVKKPTSKLWHPPRVCRKVYQYRGGSASSTRAK